MKIARGKVKEFDSYTCPICDWRVKIPRDAARPKLEELLDWQAEIPDLPFQPEEEQVLESIIDQATSFREFVRPLVHSAACMTAEEVPTQIFYLRKMEGAEVLLAFETNYFRQEIHKWSPVAPEPPPILEVSLSTRKPRPTKQQKMMAQLGVEKPEDLPLHLRTKQHTFSSKRKSTESQTSGRPPPLQPAPVLRSNTPSGDPRSVSTGNAPTPTTTTMAAAGPASQHPTAFSFSQPFPIPNDASPSYAPTTSAYLPAVNNVHSPSFDPPSPSHHQGLDPSLFSPPSFSRNNPLHPQTLGKDHDDMGGPMAFTSSPRGGDMEDIFAEMTNQDTEQIGALEVSHANEALEALRSASNSGARCRSTSRSGDDFDAENGDGTMGDEGQGRDGEDTSNNCLADEFLT